MAFEIVQIPDATALGQQQPRTRAQRTVRQRYKLGRQQVRHALQLARCLQIPGEREQALAALLRLRRREAQRMLGQLHGLLARPARRRGASRGGDRGGEPRIWTVGRERDVQRAQLLVDDRSR